MTQFTGTKQHILFTINPSAGSGAAEALAAQIRHFFENHPQGENWEITLQTSVCDANYCTTLVEQLNSKPVDILAAVGGDGTIQTLLPILRQYPHMKLGLIPGGTGNLLARNLGIPVTLEGALETLLEDHVRQIDLGLVNNHPFVLVANMGMPTEAVERVYTKAFLGGWSYFVDGIFRLFQARQAVYRITTPKRTFCFKGLGVVIANAANLLAPYLPTITDARPDDNLLDVCLIRLNSPRHYLSILIDLFSNRDSGVLDETITYFQTRRIKIESWPRTSVALDGNLMGMTPVEIEIMPQAISVLVPRQLADHQWQFDPKSHLEQNLKKLLTKRECANTAASSSRK